MLTPDIHTEHQTRPQNKSCPAGGIKKAKRPQEVCSDGGDRGVIVAPPSRNTDEPNMEVLHRGFDTLAVSIQANIPPQLFDFLEEERERAETEMQDVLVEYSGIQFHLKQYGGNGYRFILSGGRDGATWFFKKPNSRDKWGIRVSFGSYFLAIFGLAAAQLHLENRLASLGVRFGDQDVSISRIDYCVDVLASDFVLHPENFVMHSSTNRRDFIVSSDMSVNGKSGRTTSVTIGGTRNRQIIIYDKRAEIIHSGKAHWWEIWNHEREMNGKEPLEPKNTANRVWRIEFRAGKDLLKDTWGIRTWADLHDQFGDLCRHSGEVVRYTEPSPSDPNRARWPNHLLWEIVCAEMNGDLCEMRSGCDPNPLKEVHKEQHISVLLRIILGTSITLAALRGVKSDGLPDFFSGMADELTGMAKSNPTKTSKSLENAGNRYAFVGDVKPRV